MINIDWEINGTENVGGLFETINLKEYVEDLGSPSYNLIMTLKFPKSLLQFVGLILIMVLDIDVTKEGEDNIDAVKL